MVRQHDPYHLAALDGRNELMAAMPLLTVHNPWMRDFQALPDAELLVHWQTLNQRDVTQWQGVELSLFLAAFADCRDEVHRRRLNA